MKNGDYVLVICLESLLLPAVACLVYPASAMLIVAMYLHYGGLLGAIAATIGMAACTFSNDEEGMGTAAVCMAIFIVVSMFGYGLLSVISGK